MKFVDLNTLHPNNRVLREVFNERAVWVKYAVPEKLPLAPRIQNFLAPVLRRPIARSTYIADRKAALQFEAGRLEELRHQGFRVPHVLLRHDDYLVLSDMGASLEAVLCDLPHAADRKDLLREASYALGVLHGYGQYHGRPKPGDMTVRGSAIGFIDLEQDALSVMPLHDAQARDAWLFFNSATPHLKNAAQDLPDIIGAYMRAAPFAALDAMQQGLAIMRPVERIISPFARGTPPGFCVMNAALRTALAARPVPMRRAVRGAAGTAARSASQSQRPDARLPTAKPRP